MPNPSWFVRRERAHNSELSQRLDRHFISASASSPTMKRRLRECLRWHWSGRRWQALTLLDPRALSLCVSRPKVNLAKSWSELDFRQKQCRITHCLPRHRLLTSVGVHSRIFREVFVFLFFRSPVLCLAACFSHWIRENANFHTLPRVAYLFTTKGRIPCISRHRYLPFHILAYLGTCACNQWDIISHCPPPPPTPPRKPG